MKKKYDEGFTLVELLVSIVILAAIVVPTCSSLVLSYRMNAKTNQIMQAQLAVSSAVEKLMAEGIDSKRAEAILAKNGTEYDFAWTGEGFSKTDDYSNVIITIDKNKSTDAYYAITVTDDDRLVSIDTYIRIAKGGSGS